MVFRPTGRFRPEHLAEIEREFFESAAGIDFDRANSRLFPTEEEAAALRARGFRTGHYSSRGPHGRVIIGSPLSEVTVDVVCGAGVLPLNPDIHRLFTGLHEAAHLFVNVNHETDRSSIVSRARTEMNPGGLRDPLRAMQQTIYLRTYYGESAGDVAAAIYMLNKYPDDPRIREFLTNLANFRTARGSEAGLHDLYHDTGDVLRRLLAMPREGNPLFNAGQGITIEQATALAVSHIGNNFSEFLRDFRTLHELHRRIDAPGAPSDDDYARIYRVTPADMATLREKQEDIAARRARFCALTPPP